MVHRNRYVMLFFCILMSSCNSNKPSTIAELPIPTITPSPSLTPTLTFTSTITNTPTLTPTPTPEAISLFNINYLNIIKTYGNNSSNGCSDPIATLSPNEKHFTTCEREGVVGLWDTDTNTKIKELIGHKSFVVSYQFSPDSKYLLTTDWNNVVIQWDVSTGQIIRTFDNMDYPAWSPDGKLFVASNSYGNQLIFVDIDSGKIIKYLACGGDCGEEFRFSPDGSTLAWIRNSDKKIFLQNMKNWQVEKSLSGNIYAPARLGYEQFSPEYSWDGRLFATMDRFCTVVIWDVASGKILHFFDPYSGKTGLGQVEVSLETGWSYTGISKHPLAFSPDGKIMAVGYYGGSIILWDVDTVKPLFIRRGNPSWYSNSTMIVSLKFSADGTRLYSSNHNNLISVWGITNLLNPTSTSTPVASKIVLEKDGSFPGYASATYILQLDTGSYYVDLNTDDNRSVCLLAWGIDPVINPTPNHPLGYGDSNVLGTFSISKSGKYSFGIGMPRFTNQCQPFKYSLRIFQS